MTPDNHPSTHWRLRKTRLTFIGEICDCGQHIMPPGDVCPECKTATYTAFNPNTRKYESRSMYIGEIRSQQELDLSVK